MDKSDFKQMAATILKGTNYVTDFDQAELQKILDACRDDPKLKPVAVQVEQRLELLQMKQTVHQSGRLLKNVNRGRLATQYKTNHMNHHLSQSNVKWLKVCCQIGLILLLILGLCGGGSAITDLYMPSDKEKLIWGCVIISVVIAQIAVEVLIFVL